MSDWTKGPWRQREGYSVMAGEKLILAHRLWGDVGTEEAQANARRIVACVNACRDLTTEELEEEPNLYALRGMVNACNEVRAQRDELLAVCEVLGDDIQRYLERGGTLTETELRHYERLLMVVLRCGLAQAPPAEEAP